MTNPNLGFGQSYQVFIKFYYFLVSMRGPILSKTLFPPADKEKIVSIDLLPRKPPSDTMKKPPSKLGFITSIRREVAATFVGSMQGATNSGGYFVN